jgi:hypothetical protein
MKKLAVTFVAVFAVSAAALAGGLKPKALPAVAPEPGNVSSWKPVPPALPALVSPTATPTGLTGFYDWQSNGGCTRYVRVDPATGDIHTVYMLSDDSLNIAGSRSTGYGYSTDGGVTWNTFNNLRIPGTRASGYPYLDIGKGTIAGSPVVANHSSGGTPGTQTFVYIDAPPGIGAFTELQTAPLIAGTAQPIWPNMAAAYDGSIVFHASPNIDPNQNYLTRTPDYTTWSTWAQYPGFNDRGGRYPTQANPNGRVGSLLQAVANGVFWLESTDHGVTWPAVATTIHESATNGGRVAGADTFQAWVGADFVYVGDDAKIVVDELGIGVNDPTESGYIAFWSSATGWVEIARPANTPGAILFRHRATSNYFTMGWPTIGVSGTDLVVAFNAMQADTSAVGFNFSDVFVCRSTNGGATWSLPSNVTNTPALDERYPSLSPWNEAGFVNIVWQEDTQPGSHAFTDNAPLSRSWQAFRKIDLSTLVGVSTEGVPPSEFRVSQNYPNPFNPTTTIDYTVPRGTNVRLVVYNALGQEVATLVDGYRNAGSYAAEFSATKVASGVYFYTLTAGEFTSTKRMVLMK